MMYRKIVVISFPALWTAAIRPSLFNVVVLQGTVELYLCCGVAGERGVIFMLWCCRGPWSYIYVVVL